MNEVSIYEQQNKASRVRNLPYEEPTDYRKLQKNSKTNSPADTRQNKNISIEDDPNNNENQQVSSLVKNNPAIPALNSSISITIPDSNNDKSRTITPADTSDKIIANSRKIRRTHTKSTRKKNT